MLEAVKGKVEVAFGVDENETLRANSPALLSIKINNHPVNRIFTAELRLTSS